MPRGGKRPGAGRPKGSADKRSKAVADAILADGETMPLQYAIAVMRDPEADQRRRDRMCEVAMPFMHTRLAAISHTIQHKPAAQLSDDELTSIAAGGSNGAAEAPDDPSQLN